MAVDALYAMMRAAENQLGGGEGVEGIYGSLTRGGMERVVDALKTHTAFSEHSTLIDIGSGLGRPLAHAAVDPGVRRGIGIELDPVKHSKAQAFIGRLSRGMEAAGHAHALESIQLVNCGVEQHSDLAGVTHAYAFWEGFNDADKKAVGRLVAATPSLRGMAVVQRAMRRDPAQEMRDLGFPDVQLLDAVRVSMSGSGRRFVAYVFATV